MEIGFTPFSVKSLHCNNRFLRSATWERKSTEDGHMTPRLQEVYEELAKNGVGLICTGMTRITKEECANPNMLGIYEDCFIKEYQALTNLIHQYGSKMMIQIAYGGTKTTYQTENRTIFAPSDIPEKMTGTKGTPMTEKDIAYVVQAHAEAAKRVKESGFDAVELHAAHFYLLNQFLSPYYNRRNDQYGGSLENRARFLKECYEAVRDVVGDDFPIFVKVPCSDFMEDGFSFAECRTLCAWLEQWGVDAVEITGNNYMECRKLAGKMLDGYTIQKDGYFSEFAAVLAKERSMAIFVTGGFQTIEHCNDMIENECLTGIGLSRPFFTEPHLLTRWQKDMQQKVKCVRCGKCRTDHGNYCTTFQNALF